MDPDDPVGVDVVARHPGDQFVQRDPGLESGEWSTHAKMAATAEADEGPGIANTANLFVPFFTTKPGGSGIGLVFSRQIAEAHGGELTLKNRADARGCEARLRLPI